MPFVIPDRPAFPVDETNISKVVAKLRSESFTIAEDTVRRLRDDTAAICLLGKLHLRCGNTDIAKKIWNDALSLDPNCSDAWIDLGNAELLLGNPEKAELYFRNAIKSTKDSFDVQLTLSKLLMEQGKLNEAVEQLTQMVKTNARRSDVWCKLGLANQQLREFPKAITNYEKALQIDKDSWEAILGMQTAYRSLGDSENAAKYTQILSDPSKNKAERVRDERADLDEAKAIEYFEFVCQTAANIHLKAVDTAGATTTLEKAIQVAPESDDIRRMLLSLYVKQKRETSAIELLQSRCNQSSNPFNANLELGVFCMKVRKLDLAESALRKAISLSPNHSEPYSLLSQIQMTKPNEVLLAVESAKRALSLLPLASNHYILATAMYHAKDMAGARKELMEAIRLEPGNVEFRDAFARLPK